MSVIERMLRSVLRRSAWLLGPDRAEWRRGLVAEASEMGDGRGRVVWLLGGVWLLAGELWRGAIRVLMFIAAAGVVVWVTLPRSSSDVAVPINRIAVPPFLGWMALLPLLVRRFYGPVRDGWLPWAVRVGPRACRFQGRLAAVCAAGTAALVLAALTTGTIAIFPHKVRLFSPPRTAAAPRAAPNPS